MVKQALKRRKPGFNESYYGFRSFNGMLEEAERRGSLKLERDEKSGGLPRPGGGDGRSERLTGPVRRRTHAPPVRRDRRSTAARTGGRVRPA